MMSIGMSRKNGKPKSKHEKNIFSFLCTVVHLKKNDIVSSRQVWNCVYNLVMCCLIGRKIWDSGRYFVKSECLVIIFSPPVYWKIRLVFNIELELSTTYGAYQLIQFNSNSSSYPHSFKEKQMWKNTKKRRHIYSHRNLRVDPSFDDFGDWIHHSVLYRSCIIIRMVWAVLYS